jgi:Primosomal protein N'' (replication factor Y) - superfamily II helicase
MLSSISSTPPLKQPVHPAVIIPFASLSHKKTPFQPCIFCGQTMEIKKFKGKTVCIHCLHQIPDIFSCR